MDTYENIKFFREKRGLSQEELAVMVGYKDRSSIAKIEAGSVDLSQSKIAAFAKALNVSPARLMGFTSQPQAPDRLPPLSPKLQQIAAAMDELNEEGQDKIVEYASDLVASGRYIKSDSPELGQKQA